MKKFVEVKIKLGLFIGTENSEEKERNVELLISLLKENFVFKDLGMLLEKDTIFSSHIGLISNNFVETTILDDGTYGNAFFGKPEIHKKIEDLKKCAVLFNLYEEFLNTVLLLGKQIDSDISLIQLAVKIKGGGQSLLYSTETVVKGKKGSN